MTKNLPLRKMHFMAQRVRAAGQAMQRKDDCSRPLAQGLCGGIPHDVQDFLRPPVQPAVLSAARFYDLCAEELLLLRMPTGEEAGAGTADLWHAGMGRNGRSHPSGAASKAVWCKKEIGGPFRERLSLFGAVCSSPFLTK